MDFTQNLALVLVLCTVLSLMAWKFQLMTTSGALASFGVGMVIGTFGSWKWLLVLIAFAILGFAATKYQFSSKKEMGVQEGNGGERTHRNVIANAFVPAMIAILTWATGMQGEPLANVTYLASVAVAASDTIASELGVLSKRTYLITTRELVPTGIDGGVSLSGTAWALVGAFVAAIVGWTIMEPGSLLSPLWIIAGAAGFIGCVLDSVIGATLERRGMIGKLGNNMTTMAIGALLAASLTLLII